MYSLLVADDHPLFVTIIAPLPAPPRVKIAHKTKNLKARKGNNFDDDL